MISTSTLSFSTEDSSLLGVGTTVHNFSVDILGVQGLSLCVDHRATLVTEMKLSWLGHFPNYQGVHQRLWNILGQGQKKVTLLRSWIYMHQLLLTNLAMFVPNPGPFTGKCWMIITRSCSLHPLHHHFYRSSEVMLTRQSYSLKAQQSKKCRVSSQNQTQREKIIYFYKTDW